MAKVSSPEEVSISACRECCDCRVPRRRSRNSRSASSSSWTSSDRFGPLLGGVLRVLRWSASFSSSRSSSSTTSRYWDTEDEKRDLEGSLGDDWSGSSNEVSISSFELGGSRKRDVLVPGVDRDCCWLGEGRVNLEDRVADAGDGDG